MNLRKLKLSTLAEQDLKEIADYGKRFFTMETNKKFQQGLKQVLHLLRQPYCEIGTRRDEIKQDLLMFPYKGYNIYFYRIPNEIYLLRILRSDIDTLDPNYFQSF